MVETFFDWLHTTGADRLLEVRYKPDLFEGCHRSLIVHRCCLTCLLITLLTVLMFTDDLKFFSPTESFINVNRMQKDLNNLCIWNDKNNLHMNVGKCFSISLY